MPLVALGALAYAAGLLAAFDLPIGGALALAALGLAGAAHAVITRHGARAATVTIMAAGVLIGLARVQSDAARHAQLGLSDGWAVGSNSTADSGRLAAVRARAGARIDGLFGTDAPIVRALVIADMSGVPAEQRDRFARAGLVHMLSVSGLHVAIIALALELLASALRAPPRPARICTLLLLAVYVAGIGAPAPAVRAAVMLGLLLASRLLQRPTSPWAVLAVGGVAPLVDSRTALDLGWQLSVAGTIALVAGGSLAARLIPRSMRGRSLARAAVVSVVATIVTAPLVAWTFGRIALLSPFTNLLADPIMGVLQPVLFLALCIPIAPVERITADAAHLLLVGFDTIATRAASVPGGAPLVLPTQLAAVAGLVGATAIVVACVAERPTRPALIALSAVALMIVEPFATPVRGTTELHMIDVGQGDAIAIRTRRGQWIVVDAGRSWIGGDAGKSVVVPYIAHRGGAVALFVLSHPHADHVGGAASLFAALHPRLFLDPGYVGTTPPYLAALSEASSDRIPWQRVHPGDSLVVDEVVVSSLAPDSAWAAGLNDANLASTVLLVRVGNVRMLLTGDAEAPEEDWLLDHGGDGLHADVLKVAHHGSRTSTSPRFLAAVQPRLALVSVGAHNSYGHPDREVLDRLDSAGVLTLRTDLSGSIVVRTDGSTLDVESRGIRWSVPRTRTAPTRSPDP